MVPGIRITTLVFEGEGDVVELKSCSFREVEDLRITGEEWCTVSGTD
jgi:hypothetical protein